MALSTKEEILVMLKTTGALTVSDISKELGITEMAVRRHLNTLERDELIKSTLVRQAMGRPTHLYSLTEKAEDKFPKTYRDLAKDILDEIAESDGIGKIDILFQQREKRLRKRYLTKINPSSDLKDKINSLVQIQSEKGYMVELEETDEAYIIREKNCPISEIAKDYGQACDGEKKLFENVLQAKVDSVQCMTKGDRSCVYLIKKNNETNK